MNGRTSKSRCSMVIALVGLGLAVITGGCVAEDASVGDLGYVAEVGADDLAGGPGGSSARIQRVDMVTDLSPANELPPLLAGNPEAGVTGTGKLRVQIHRNERNRPTGAAAVMLFSLCGFSGTSLTVVGADVRAGSPDEESPDPWIIGTASEAEPAIFEVTNGCVQDGVGGEAPPGQSLAFLAQQVVANPSGYYLQIRTAQTPDGMARGQLDYMQAP